MQLCNRVAVLENSLYLDLRVTFNYNELARSATTALCECVALVSVSAGTGNTTPVLRLNAFVYKRDSGRDSMNCTIK